MELENRIYSTKELYEILQINTKSNNGPRNLKAKLEELGYQYSWPNRSRKVEILGKGTPKAKQLTSILSENSQIDEIGYSCFIAACLNKEFCEAPMKTKIIMLKERYGVLITEKTYQRWKNQLVKKGLLVRDEDTFIRWRTKGYDEDKKQSRVSGIAAMEAEAAEYQEAKEQETWRIQNERQLDRTAAQTDAIKSLYGLYGCFYNIHPWNLLPLDEIPDEYIDDINKACEIAKGKLRS